MTAHELWYCVICVTFPPTLTHPHRQVDNVSLYGGGVGGQSSGCGGSGWQQGMSDQRLHSGGRGRMVSHLIHQTSAGLRSRCRGMRISMHGYLWECWFCFESIAYNFFLAHVHCTFTYTLVKLHVHVHCMWQYVFPLFLYFPWKWVSKQYFCWQLNSWNTY